MWLGLTAISFPSASLPSLLDTEADFGPRRGRVLLKVLIYEPIRFSEMVLRSARIVNNLLSLWLKITY